MSSSRDLCSTPLMLRGSASPWSQEGIRPGRNRVFVPVELEGVEREVADLTLQVRAGWGAQGPVAPQIQCSCRAGSAGRRSSTSMSSGCVPSSSPCENRADPSDKAQKHQHEEVQILNSA